jgi:hypothetical protein
MGERDAQCNTVQYNSIHTTSVCLSVCLYVYQSVKLLYVVLYFHMLCCTTMCSLQVMTLGWLRVVRGENEYQVSGLILNGYNTHL